MKEPFVHLHVRSYYSLLYGTISIEKLVRSARDQGYSAIALTDINNLYGVHDFIAECKKQDMTPIIGAELQGVRDRAVVLAQDRQGFSNISTLITRVKREEPVNLSQELINHNQGTIVLSDSPSLLQGVRGEVSNLYAMVASGTRRIIGTARSLGIPLVATGEVTFFDIKDYHLHRVLRAINSQTTVSAVDTGELVPEEAILFTPDRACELFSDVPLALENTVKIAEACNFREIFQGFIFPSHVPEEGTTPAEELRAKTYTGAEKRYGELSESVVERIEYELGIIEEKGFSTYFLVVGDIVSRASRTCGRGSGAASIVSYSLGITNVDPIKYNLYFERFLNPDRTDPPDIDIDFAWDERDKLIEDVMADYGRDRSAMVCTLIHFKARSAIRDVARTYGMPDNEITALQKKLLRRTGPADVDLDQDWQEVLETALAIKGFPKHLSVHVGGVVMTPEPMDHYVPVETAPKQVPIITWDKDGSEAGGLVKIDLLGNRSLAVIRDSLANMEENGVHLDPYLWHPTEDKATQKLVAEGNTMGVFYVESPAMRQLQKKTAVGDYEHLVIHSSIIRPAANKFINEYVDRLNGKPYQALHPRLEYILKETYGIMCYQEDVSKVAVALADFSPAKADGLRKILSKKNKEEKLREYREQFFENASKNGVRGETIEKIWEMICSFDGYSFCKPHSASYAMVSFQSAYIKAHYPAEFMAAVISNGGGFYTPSAYISEAKRLGLQVLRPDINESRYAYHGKGRELRVGLMALSEMRYNTIKYILEERKRGGRFTSMADLLMRVNVPPGDCEVLIHAGVLDSIAQGANRPQQHWSVLMLNKGRHREQEQSSLFPVMPADLQVPEMKDLTQEEKLAYEYRYLGFLCNTHPLRFWKRQTAGLGGIQARDITRFIGRSVRIIGWLVTRKGILTIKGQPMEFVSFEDETDIFETVIFPDTYEKYGHLLNEERPLVISGTVDQDRNAVYVQVESLTKV